MKLATFIAPGHTEPLAGEVRDGQVIAFGDGSSVAERLSIGGGPPANGDTWSLDRVRLLAPVPDPGAIYCIALNYREHAEEAGMPLPERPVAFLKQQGSVISGFGEVRKPAVTNKLDYEGELVVVIGADGKPGGYAVGNDVSARDLQKLEFQWARAKGADTFCPWGPWVTTVDEVPNPQNLDIKTWVNDELRQNSNTSDLVFSIDHIIRTLSETADLRPGDIILTGTPPGIGESYGKFLQPGDIVRIAIEGLGEIEHRIIER
ncbi:fumarylacetoacetate hydrolase family protein [Rubrobacter calidifluminis]|uniref:fumarylacetoacetate hydrolase family protein n=1 Tax=Rubrobacter calidifluminis TaxID=1392640 RepID=UPI00235F2E15|nr:fumarylacetoacetate hydrolase family protein [Rubrobacter calidifluminis]